MLEESERKWTEKKKAQETKENTLSESKRYKNLIWQNMVYDFLTTATGKQGCWENSKDTRKLSPGPAWCTICKAIRLRSATCSIFLTSIARCPRLTAESSGALVGAGPSSCIRCWTATKWSYDFWYCSLTCAPKTELRSEPAGPITTDGPKPFTNCQTPIKLQIPTTHQM